MVHFASTVIALAFSTSLLHGQCIMGNQNAQQSDPTGIPLGQSFTPTCNGDIEYVELISPNSMGNNTAGTLKIYNGSTVLSTPIHTQAYPVTPIGPGGAVRIYLAAPVPVVAFQQKTFEMDMSVPINFAGNNPYSGGRLFYNHTNSSTHAGSDLKFNVSVISNCTNTSASITADACDAYTSPSGMTWSSSGIYMDTIPNMSGCDSLITVDLEVTTLDTTVSMNGMQMTANEANASYQWLDCNNGNAPIPGADQQTFMPPASGSYAVELSANGCVSTSDCFFVGSTGLIDGSQSGVSVFPVPTNGQLQLQGISTTWSIRIMDIQGNTLPFERTADRLELLQPAPGLHLLQYTTPIGQVGIVRFVVQ